jgi:hypothetical protein
VTSPYEHGNELSGSIKGWEFLEFLSDYWLLKKDLKCFDMTIKLYFFKSRII